MKHIALLRGINVGGKNRLPIKDLAELFVEAGCSRIETYIQSGNVVFEAPDAVLKGLPEAISAAILDRFGYEIPVIVRSAAQMSGVVESNPFLGTDTPEKKLHVYFLAETPGAAAVESLDPDRSPPDEFVLKGLEVYLRLPNGMGRTKLTNAYFDSKLGTACTARNWKTVCRLAEMARN